MKQIQLKRDNIPTNKACSCSGIVLTSYAVKKRRKRINKIGGLTVAEFQATGLGMRKFIMKRV